jgi:deoxyribonuclease-4
LSVGKKTLIGFHVSIAGSIDQAVDRAVGLNCTAFQMFTRNPRGWNFKPLKDEEVSSFIQKRRGARYERIVVHMPYLPNLASSTKSVIKKSRASLREEVHRCGQLEVDYVVAHIGSHMGKGSAAGVRNVIAACNEALDADPGGPTTVLIENMAGQKNCVGDGFEELRMILDGVEQRDRVGICFDTCHAFAAGFDLSTATGVSETFKLFDEVIGLDNLKVVHLNDSRGALGSNLDRHEHIGMGRIGEGGFRALLSRDGISDLPLLMETPQDEKRSDTDEMAFVKSLLDGSRVSSTPAGP